MILKKSQVSIEFSFLVGLAFLIVIIFMASISSKTADLSKDKEFVLVRDVGYKIQSEINLAFRSENGYYREFELPEKLDGRYNYSIPINGNLLLVQGKDHDFLVTIANVTGDLTKGTNKICKNSDQIYLGDSYC